MQSKRALSCVHRLALPAARLISASSHVPHEARGERWSWLTNTSVLPVLRAGRQQQVEKGFAPVFVERGGRLVGDHHFGLADERARRGHALLLADRQLRAARVQQCRSEAHPLEQRSASSRRAAFRSPPAPRAA